MVALALPLIASATTAVTGTAMAANTLATIGTAISTAGTLFSLGSAISGYQESKAQSKAIKQTAAYNAEVDRQQAISERATGLQEAKEQRRSTRYAMSEALAAGAKGGAVDPTTINILGNIASEGELRARTKMFESENAAKNLESEANMGIWEAKNQARATRRKGLTTALSGATSAFDGFKKYKEADVKGMLK